MRLTSRQLAMLAFLEAHGRRSWLDTVSINGRIGDGFVVQTAGTIPPLATEGLNELVRIGAVVDAAGKYSITDVGRELLVPRAARRRRDASPQLDFLSIDTKGGR